MGKDPYMQHPPSAKKKRISMIFFTSLIYEFFYSVTIMVVIEKAILYSLSKNPTCMYFMVLPWFSFCKWTN